MLKNFTLIALTCFVFIFISSCTKDSADSANPGGTSLYAFDGAPGTCATPAIAGIYAVGQPLNLSNTLTFTVNVIVKGTYSITTTPGNGVAFGGSGTFTTTGPQTVVLTGSGTPINAGNFPYVPVTSNTCNFTVSFLSGAPAAVFTYAGGSGACTAPVISGTYAVGVPMGSGNYVDLAVNVTTPGAYTVSTTSNNGMSFSGSGAFSANGAQVLRLIGNGTPAAQGPFTFKPTGGCDFSITVAPPPPPAAFTYTCAPAVITGTFAAGTALTSSSTIKVEVNVTTAGLYSVTTTSGSGNGVTFSGSGVFSGTGIKTITLTSTNTPAAAGTFTYTPSGAGCSFDVTYTSGGGGGGGGGGTPTMFLKATVGGVVTNFNTALLAIGDPASGTFSVSGTNSDGGSDDIQISVSDLSNPLAAGDYNNFSLSSLTKGCQVAYNTIAYVTGINANSFVVHLTTITANSASGTFSGTLYDNNGAGPGTKSVTAGSFNVTY
jgi:hypothetical protein